MHASYFIFHDGGMFQSYILCKSWTGSPPETGTATVNIHVTDQNDHIPQPTEQELDVCLSDKPTTTNITATDPDQNPFGGPFTFELLGDVKGKWKLDPSYGRSIKSLYLNKTGKAELKTNNNHLIVFIAFHRLYSRPGEGAQFICWNIHN